MYFDFSLKRFHLLAILVLLQIKVFSQGNLTWATYYGGSLVDRVTAVKLDANGNVYIAGKSESTTPIATAGTYQTANAGMADAFIAKFDANGNRLWASYFGGPDNDEAFSLAIAPNGAVYISGMTLSSTGVASSGSHQTIFGGLVDAFLAKFDATNGSLIWSTYLGGAAFDEAQAVETDAAGNVYITGSTQSNTGIALNAFQSALNGTVDTYLAKFNSAGNLLWSTYYGGPDVEYGYGIATDNNNVYVSGFTRSVTGFVFNGFQSVHGAGTNDVFKINIGTTTGKRIWASVYGGTGNDTVKDVEIDINGDVYMGGVTTSPNAISFNGHQNVFGGGVIYDSFLVKFDAAGNRLWATYYGGTNGDGGESVSTDAAGNVYLGGYTYSTTNIAFQGFQNTLVGTENFYIVKFTSAGVRICATYYGNNKELDGRIAVDANQNVYLAGTIFSTSSGLALNGFQSTNGGGQSDGFLSKFAPCTNIVNANFNATNLSGCEGLTVNYTNTSVGANSWNWNFGDGNTDTSQNPSNTYLNAGQYTVTLIASDGTTNDTQTFVNYITVYPFAQAISTSSSSVICVGQNVSFTNTSTNATSYSWNFGNGNTSTSSTPTTAYINSGNYTVTLIAMNTNGCNDTLTIPIQVKPNSTFTNNQTICTGNSYTLPGGNTVSNTGTYYDTLNSVNGCDSIITTNLTVTPPLTYTQNISICNGNSYTLPGGNSVNIAGMYKDTISTSLGCDSIVTTNLSVVAAILSNQNPTICTGASYTLPGGNSVNVSGTYTDTLNSSGGCDSIITTVLSVVPFITFTQSPLICQGNSFILPDGSSAINSGTYKDTLTASGGCDSIITTILTVLPNYNSTTNASICNGGSYLLPGGNTANSAGTYVDTLNSINGCDSVITTILSVVNAITVSQNPIICIGNSYTLPGGNSVNTAGTYVDTLTASGGCDSIITTTLTVSNNASFNQSPVICYGASYTLPGGTVINTSGIYTDTLVASNGCDSIVTTTLTVSSSSFATTSSDITITLGQSTTLTASGGVTYNWFPSTGLSSVNGNTVIANPISTTTYCVIVFDNNGCIDTSCVTITVEAPCADINNLAVPNAFSPNKDGINDEFCLQGWDSCLEEFNIRIFNRWGEKVFESNDSNFCWDGTYKGEIIDSQVVVYYIKAKFSNIQMPVNQKGNISLIK